MILVKDVVEHFNLDTELPKNLLEVELPVDKMFDKCELKQIKPKLYFKDYICTYNNDSPIRLDIPQMHDNYFERGVCIYGIFEDEEEKGLMYCKNGKVGYTGIPSENYYPMDF